MKSTKSLFAQHLHSATSHPFAENFSHPLQQSGSGVLLRRRFLFGSIIDESTCSSHTAHFSDSDHFAQSASTTELLSQLEAVLFIAHDPVAPRRLAMLAEIPTGTRIRPLIRELNRQYDARNCAFQVVEVAGGFQLRTRPPFAPWLFRLQEVPVEIRLSPPAMETLAVIAYKQPVLRAGIEAVRGVQCGELIRQLLDLDLIRIAGRSEELGRPFYYGTTQRFLQVFGLQSLKDLQREAEGDNAKKT